MRTKRVRADVRLKDRGNQMDEGLWVVKCKGGRVVGDKADVMLKDGEIQEGEGFIIGKCRGWRVVGDRIDLRVKDRERVERVTSSPLRKARG